MTRRERVLLVLSVAIGDRPVLLSGLQQHIRQNRLLRYTPLVYARKTLYALCTRMQEDGLIQKSKLTDKSTLFVTPKGIDALIHRYHYAGIEDKSWDKKWRIILYDVPEKYRYKREKIRMILEQRRFGMFQKSIYISPHDLLAETRAYLAQEGLLELTTAMTASQEELGDIRVLTERLFGVRALADSYRNLLRRFQFVAAQQLPEKRTAGIRTVCSEFVERIGNDPFLPAALLPQDWPFFQVRETLSSEIDYSE